LSLILYCICALADLRRVSVPPSADDPEGLCWLEADPLAALTAPAPAQDDVDAMLAFGRVVAHCHGFLDVVPMRYDSRLPDRDAVIAHLCADSPRYQSLLAMLGGCVEMGLRLPLPDGAVARPAVGTPDAPGPPAAPASGRDYLLQRRAEMQATAAAEAALDRLDADLAGLYRRCRREEGWFAGQRRLSVHYLVPRARLAAFRDRLAAALAVGGWQLDGPRAALTSGPWPPYSFTVGDDEAGPQKR
jgi:hypothetical protein